MSEPETSSDFKTLMRQHRATHSLHRKAKLEEQMWECLTLEERRPFRGRPKYFAHALGGSERQYGERMYLLRAEHNEELWRRVEQEAMGLTTATRLHREARANAERHKIPLPDAIFLVLKEYDRLPLRKTPSGRAVRQRNPTQLSRTKQKQIKRDRRKASRLRQNGDAFWVELRDTIREYVTAQLPDGEMVEIEPVWKALETDLKVIIDDFQARLYRLRKEQREDAQPIKRRRLRVACQTLHLDPPRKGKPLDMKAVKRQKRVLARAYHPDAHGGDESMRAQYDAVLEAYRTIEQWDNEQPKEAS
jgi:uncharacterized protein YeeX (DUF496 family)